MRSIAIITPFDDVFRQWVDTMPDIRQLNRRFAAGNGWKAVHVKDESDACGVAFSELIILPGYGSPERLTALLTALIPALPERLHAMELPSMGAA
jgi:hypothetical protein